MDRGRAKGVLAAACIAIAWPGTLVFGYPGLMAQRWQEAFHVGRAALGAVLFFVLAALGIGMFTVGRWQARLGYWKLVLAGELVAAGSLLLPAAIPGLPGIYAWGFTAGVSSCLIYMPALTCVQLWWPERKGFASGVFNMAFGTSAAILSPAFAWLLRTYGEGGTHVLLAAGILLTGATAACFVKAPPPAEGIARATALPTRSLSARESLRTGAFWLLWCTWALQGAAGVSMISLAGPIVRSKGLPPAQIVSVLVAFNLANGVSRFIAGSLSDRLGRNLAMCLPFSAAAGAYFALPAVGHPTLLTGLAAAVGFAFGTLFAVSGPLALECFGPDHFGSVLGLVFTAYGFLAGLLGPWLSGLTVDLAGGSPRYACFYLGIFCLTSAVLVWGVKPGQVRSASD